MANFRRIPTRGPLNGNMADFTYDCRNRLVKVKESDGTTTEYEYDAENIRTAVISGGIKTVYTTDRESTYSQTLVKTEYEKNTWGQYTEEVSETMYTYGLGLIGERRDNNQEFYYHYNHVGSTMAVTDEAGIIYYRFVYDTYGELSDITTDDGVSLKSSEQLTEYRLAELSNATGIDYLYNGQYGVETDQNGLYYMRARYYDQDIKRFINRDVVSGDIGNSQSLNRYCYVQGNPVSLTDPFGLCPDPNSAFKNFCKFLAYTDWSAIGHAVLDTIGIFCDGADVINMFWYMAEGKWKEAGECAIYALPVIGSGLGSMLMKGSKTSKFGSALKTVSKLTQGSVSVCMGVDMATTGITNIINGIDEGNINPEDIMRTLGGIAIATASGKSVLPSGGIKRIANSISDAYKTRKANKLNELAKQIRIIDADISSIPVGERKKIGSLKMNLQFFADSAESGSKADTKPYTNSRPSFRKGVVEEVWENAKGPDGLVRDPNTGEVINWTPGESRKGVWDMGHIPEAKYSEIHEAYMNGELTTKEFVDWYNDPANYRPELPSNNRSHKYE